SQRHMVVSLDCLLNIIAVDSNSNTHDHMLRTLGDLSVNTEKVGSLKGLESEVIVAEVTIVNNGGIEFIGMAHNRFIRLLANHWRRSSIFLRPSQQEIP